MIRNIHFTLLIRIDKQLHEFNFRKRSPDLYDGDTSDERGNRYYFKMVKQDDTWKIQGRDVPGWIILNERVIAEALVRQKTLD